MTRFASVFLMTVASIGMAATPLPRATSIDLSKAKENVEFLAVGSPSAIKIRGKAKEENGEKTLKGNLSLDGRNLTGTARIKLDTFDTGMELRNKHMKEKYLETQKFPEADLVITKLTLPESATGETFNAEGVPFTGDLTLHGVKKPVTGTSSVKRTASAIELAFEFSVPMESYGIETPSFMGIKVTKDVSINVQVEAPLEAKN